MTDKPDTDWETVLQTYQVARQHHKILSREYYQAENELMQTTSFILKHPAPNLWGLALKIKIVLAEHEWGDDCKHVMESLLADVMGFVAVSSCYRE